MRYSNNPHVFSQPKVAIILAFLPFFSMGLLNGFYMEFLYSMEATYFWIADLLQFVLVPAASLYFLYRLVGFTPAQYGFVLPPTNVGWVRVVFWSLFLTLLLWPVLGWTERLFQALLPASKVLFTFHSVLPQGGYRRVVGILYFAVTAGLVEEVYYRGLVLAFWQQFQMSSLPDFAYLFSSALLFGVIHWEYGIHYVLTTSCCGLVLGLIYLHLRNLWPFVISHTIADLISFY